MPGRGGSGSGYAPRGAQPGRDLRSRVASRGGIQKRRNAGPQRTDGDGDLEMDRPSNNNDNSLPRGASSSRRGGRAGTGVGGRALQTINRHMNGEPGLSARSTNIPRGPRAQRGGSLSWLKVHGLLQSKAASNINNGMRDLVSFLERKAAAFSSTRRPFVIKKSRLEGDYVLIGVSEDDVDGMLRTNGVQFAGTTLRVTLTDSRPSSSQGVSVTAQETRTKLQAVLNKRLDPVLKLIKLDFLSMDEELVRLGMFESKERAQKTFEVFMVIFDDMYKTPGKKRDSVDSITIANNGIDDIKQVGDLANTFPDIKNLDISGNALPNVAALELWKNKFRDLVMINVAGNPLAADPTHQQQLMQWFPKLQVVDGVQVRTPDEAAASVNLGKPRPIPHAGLDFRDANGVGEQFLLEFFAGYDNDRAGLIGKYYDDHSQFSLSVDTASVRDPNAPPPMSWSAYLKYSRNLQKVTHPSTRVQRLLKGPALILDMWKLLPHTKHPDIKLEVSKYIVDCHILPGLVDPSGNSGLGVDGMIITVQGEFDEHEAKTNTVGKRGFSRTFILGPGMPGRNPIRVVSDMWTLRAFSPLPDVHNAQTAQQQQQVQQPIPQQQVQQPIPQQQQLVQPVPVAQPSEEEQKQALVAELCRQTGMTIQYSQLCLSEVGWDLARGVAIFNERRAQLPADAFMAPQ